MRVALTCPEITSAAAPAGTAYVKFSRSGTRTITTRAFATSPIKLFTTHHRGGACWIFHATFGGGFVGGDTVDMSVDVESGSTALVTTQASTKVYRSLSPARQSMHATVDDGALLAVMPDPIVCFADADFSQLQQYRLSPTANLVLVDWLTSGRHAMGERWAFARYASRIDIIRDGRRILYDGLALDRRARVDSIRERFGRFNVLATVVITGPEINNTAKTFVSAIAEHTIERYANVIESACALPDGGTLWRMAGTSVEEIGRLIRTRLAFVEPRLGDDPWRRKW